MTDVPQAQVQTRRFPLIWLVPLAAVGIAVWLGVRTLGDHGPLVTITLSSGEGLEAGRTRVMLRNVEVGTVESLELSKDLTHVVVNARIRRDSSAPTSPPGPSSGWSGRGWGSAGCRG